MAMFRQSKTNILRANAVNAKELAVALSRDRKFRKQLLSALGHGAAARRRAARRIGMTAVLTRLAADRELRRELVRMSKNAQNAWARVEKKRSHRLRNVLVVLGGTATAAGLIQSRGWLRSRVSTPGLGRGSGERMISETVEVEVPVTTAYNQWTQFEDFPLFMEGVEHVEQKGDTRLHWVAKVGGKTNEWDAKILEQHPDKQVSWISEDGKKTRGTVTFEPIGESRTRITLSMSYQAEGLTETLGSAVGLDQRRVRGDLERFKELIESRGAESGAWRGEVSAGTTK
jgi:uncharacterized membrane protein